VICQTFWEKLVGLEWELVQRWKYAVTTWEVKQIICSRNTFLFHFIGV